MGSADRVQIGVAQRIVQEIDRICDAWWLNRETFEPQANAPLIREHRMQLAFRNRLRTALREKYASEFAVMDKDAWPFAGLGKKTLSDAFSRYDVAVTAGPDLAALLELSIDDSTVCHALDNGEHKLLGICDGIGCVSEKPFWQTRKLTTEDVAFAQGRLSAIPVRGLFYVSRLPHQSLDILQSSVWTDGGSRPFNSALIQSPMTSLEEALERLNQAGLFIWYYSLVDDRQLKLRPSGFGSN